MHSYFVAGLVGLTAEIEKHFNPCWAPRKQTFSNHAAFML